MNLDEIFSAFHWLTGLAVIILIVTGIVVAIILARVFKKDFEQD